MRAFRGAELGDQVRDALALRDVDGRPDQARTHAAPLPGIGHGHGQVPVVGRVDARHPGDGRELGRRRVVLQDLGDERELAVVVDEADPGEAVVRRPLGERPVDAVAGDDGLGRQAGVEAGRAWARPRAGSAG